jgi:hypothetical protein
MATADTNNYGGRNHFGKSIMRKIRSLLFAITVATLTFSALYVVGELEWIQNWVKAHHFEEQFKDVRVKLNGILSWAMGIIAGLIKAYFPLTDSSQSTDDEKPVPPPDETKNVDWKGEYDRIRAEYLRLHGTYKQLGAEARRLLGNQSHNIKELHETVAKLVTDADRHMERRGVLKLTLYCGLALALASGVITLLTNPAKLATPDASAHHQWMMLFGFAGVSAIFAFSAIIMRGYPHRRVPVLMFGVAALYVNTCALVISVPYSIDQLFGSATRTVLGFPMPIGIGLSRLVILPLAAVFGSIVGTALAGGFMGTRIEPAPSGPVAAAT